MLCVELTVLLYLIHLSTYEFKKYSSGLTVLSVIYLKSSLLTSTMGDEHPLYGPSLPSMTFSEHLRSSPSAVSRSIPRIIFYLPVVDF